MNPSQQLPSIELIQGNGPQAAMPAKARGRRWKVFLSVLLLGALIGLAIVYARTPLYRASAQVLTVQPKAVDAQSAAADVEHVAIQGRLLLSDGLLGRLSATLAEHQDPLYVDVDGLRAMLTAQPVADTNLLELRAEGDDPQALQRIVNDWADAYEVFRAEQTGIATGRTTDELESERARLETRIEQARSELRTFREENDIVGLERGENKSLASLRGLNNSLNKAREQLIAAQARQAAVDEAIARGETVIPDQLKEQIAFLRLEVQRLQSVLAELRSKYTKAYLDRDPALKTLPGQLAARQRELDDALKIARTTVADEAAQAVAAARVSLDVTERQLAAQQADAQQFNDRYKTFQTHEENLSRLEGLLAANRERVAQIQVKNQAEFPPIQIVDRAHLPRRPIYPDYERDRLIALGGALLLALFVTWLVDYLGEKPATHQAAPYLGVRIVTGESNAALGHSTTDDARLAYAPPAATLASPTPANAGTLPVLPRELGGTEVQALLTASDDIVAAYSALLLSGVSPYELPMIHPSLFDHDGQSLGVPGASARVLPLATGAWRRAGAMMRGAGTATTSMTVAELDQQLRATAQSIGLADPQGISALALWHTYVVYLARQGADDTLLTSRVGMIPRDVLSALRHFAPPSGVRAPAQIDFAYPPLAD
ncbi:MAG: hypothetical protein KDJ27_03160 [Gammaproteobacteria bacterium]|nr:hypothetical protein [Gammaproteobacteria bacterium]